MKIPVVGIVMGSDSDLEIMSKACEIMDEFKIPYECSIVSAHRTPNRLYSYADGAIHRGLKVIIAGAGGAAHLPGMLASLTEIPVIGIPIKLSSMDGMDSLLSIVQMPRGIPVATVAINNATNGALLAIRMLGIGDKGIIEKMKKYMDKKEKEVVNKIYKIGKIGWKNYLEKNSDKI